MKHRFVLAAMLLAGVVAVVLQDRAQAQYPGGYYGTAPGWRGTLSAKDQQEFDKDYTKWVDATRKGDQDDIQNNARKMEGIMARYNVPPNVPFAALASNPVAGAPYGQYAGAYPAYGQPLSPHDQKKFDESYAKWIDAQRQGDQEDVADHAREMQKIMAHNNIPPNVPFAAIATNGYAAGPDSGYLPANPNGYAYPNAYGYGQAVPLSDKDRKDFDKAYKNWVDARRRKDMDDVDKNARKMEDIMARYNIPANTPFDRIASPGAAYR